MTGAALSSDPELIDAILGDRLSAWARDVLGDSTSGDEIRHMASHAVSTCAAIRDRTDAEADRLVAVLGSSNIASTATGSDQRHSIAVHVEPNDAADAIAVLQQAGYGVGREWVGAAARSFHRFAGATTLTRSAAHSTVIRLRWRSPKARRSPLGDMLRRVVTPTPADWAMVDLPKRLWWAYGALRPIRLATERLGVTSDEHGDLEPFLVTPDLLLDPLFDVADVDEHDVFADIGCGDGRIVVAAARRHGCRAIGVEQSATSVRAARQRAADAGLSDRVEFVHADARDADLSEVTVAVLFVPLVVAGRLVPTLPDRLAPRARLVLHEQSRLPTTLPAPSRSVAIIAPEAVTVAHRWTP